MAIFSKKPDADKALPALSADRPAPVEAADKAAAGLRADLFLGTGVLVQPRLSEKAAALAKLGQYVFKVHPKANKVMVRKAVEKFYGVKVQSVNVAVARGKARRYGKAVGRTSNFKKAIVKLHPDSKRLELIETT